MPGKVTGGGRWGGVLCTLKKTQDIPSLLWSPPRGSWASWTSIFLRKKDWDILQTLISKDLPGHQFSQQVIT